MLKSRQLAEKWDWNFVKWTIIKKKNVMLIVNQTYNYTCL